MRRQHLLALILIIIFSLFISWSHAATNDYIEIDVTLKTPNLKALKNYPFQFSDLGFLESGIQKEVQRSPFYIVPELEGDSFLNAREGEPLLPVRTEKILIPNGKMSGDVEIIPGREIPFPGVHVVAPAQKALPLSKIASSQNHPFIIPQKEIYEKESLPSQILLSSTVQWKRGFQICLINISPILYKPKSGRLSYFESIKIKIHLKDLPASLSLSLYRGLPEDFNAIRGTVRNPEILKTYSDGASQQGYLQNTSKATPLVPPGVYKYVIITNAAFANSTVPYNFQDLLLHRQSYGLSTTIVTTEWIYATYPGTRPDGGNDNQTKIRNFIIDAYLNWGTEYVLLGGDGDGADVGGESGDDIIPARGFYVSAGGETDSNIPADMYYSCLDGSFDFDADGYYGESNDGPGGGEVDLFAEVHVGRAPVDSESEITNFVYKTITYETTLAQDFPYNRTALMLGEDLGWASWGSDYKEEIRQGSCNWGYCTTGFPVDWTVDTLYDTPSYSWTTLDAINKINSNTYHIFNHLGHANVNYCLKMYNADVDASFSNNKYIFCYSQGCYDGAFDNRGTSGSYYSYDCICEHFTTQPFGFFAVIGNSRYGWGNYYDTDGASQYFDREFFDAVFGEGIKEIGPANSDSKEDQAGYVHSDDLGRWCCYEINLFGDPAVEFGRQASHRGVLELDKVAYSHNDLLNITLRDLDLNNPAVIDIYDNITTVSSQLGDVESHIVMKETGINSSTFTGSLQIVNAPAPLLNNGILEAAHGDQIIASYQDLDDGTGHSVLVTDTALADFLPPVISEVTVTNITTNEADIVWATDEPATEEVFFGTTPELGLRASESDVTTSHILHLNGLSNNATYYFDVGSTDTAGNYTRDNNGGAHYTFTTLYGPEIDVNPLSFSVTMKEGEITTKVLTIENPGDRNLTFKIWEKATGGSINVFNLTIPSFKLSDDYDTNAPTSQGKQYLKPWTIEAPLVPGDVLDYCNSPSPITFTWGVGFDDIDIWISDYRGSSKNWDYKIHTDCTYSGVSFENYWAGVWGGDFAWDGQYLWQVNVGSPNDIKQLDPTNGQVVHSISDPNHLWDSTSQRGLAYKEEDDTFYIGGWNQDIVYHIKGLSWGTPGEILDQFPFPSIAGLAWHPDGFLFIVDNASYDKIYQVDPTDASVIRQFPLPGNNNYGGCGLELDDEGNLYAGNQNENRVYHISTEMPIDALPWLIESPTQGVVFPSEAQEIMLTFGNDTVTSGNYSGFLKINNNDADENPTWIPIALTICPAPILHYDSSYFDDDNIGGSSGDGDGYPEAGETIECYITLKNSGHLEAQNVSAIISSTSPYLTITDNQANYPDIPAESSSANLDPFVFTVSPGTPDGTAICLNVVVSASNGGPWNYNEVACFNVMPVFCISGNVIDLNTQQGVQGIEVCADGLLIQGLSSFAREKYIAEHRQSAVSLGDLTVFNEPLLGQGKNLITDGIGSLGSGGPDGFGYRWKDSDETGGPTFDWIDITGTGTRINISGDDSNTGPFSIGFNFPFYGANYTQFRLCTNGWITLDTTYTYAGYSNTSLPSTSAPPAFIAPFWDDLYVDSYPTSAVYMWSDASGTCIISFINVRRYGASERITFQIILTASGKIKYQYQTLAGTLNSCTVGIQNQARDTGLEVVCNQSYLHSELAILIFRGEPIHECVKTQADGTYRICGLPATDYEVTATVPDCYSPVSPQSVTVPPDATGVDFTLASPEIDVTPSGICTPPITLCQGNIYVETLSISNIGSDILNFSLQEMDGFSPFSQTSRIAEAAQIAVRKRLASGTSAPPKPGTADISPLITNQIISNVKPLDFTDVHFSYDVQGPSGDNQCLGVEFLNDKFYVTGGNSGSDPNKVHIFDRDGTYLSSFDQYQSSDWGWRDLATDGTYLYGSDDSQITQILPDGTFVSNLPGPGLGTCRGLAYDPQTGHFWSADWDSAIYEFGRDGTVYNSYSNSKMIYGMAWDNVSLDGPWLWVFSQDGSPAALVSQFDPRTGAYTDVQFTAPVGGDEIAGGLAFTDKWDPKYGILIAGIQGSPDRIEGYEVCIADRALWLNETPESGSVNPGETFDVELTFDATGDAPGSYGVNLLIKSNDCDEPEITVPVCMDVIPSPDLRMNDKNINDSLGGDGDGYAEPGETFDLAVLIGNEGSLPSSNIVAIFLTSDPDLTVLVPTANYPDIVVGGNAWGLSPFSVEVSASASPHEANCSLIIMDNSGCQP